MAFKVAMSDESWERPFPGVARMHIDGGYNEVVGLVRPDWLVDGKPTVFPITEVRAAEELRASMPEDVRLQEQELWDALVEASRAYFLGPGFRDWREHTRLRKRKNRLQYKYRDIVSWASPHRVPKRAAIAPRGRRAVIAAWEASGRVCGICGREVRPNEDFHVHHIIPVNWGGSSDAENLSVAHASCNVDLRDGHPELAWVASWKKQEGRCAVCDQQTRKTGSLRRLGKTLAWVYLCDEHLTLAVLVNLINVRDFGP